MAVRSRSRRASKKSRSYRPLISMSDANGPNDPPKDPTNQARLARRSSKMRYSRVIPINLRPVSTQSNVSSDASVSRSPTKSPSRQSSEISSMSPPASPTRGASSSNGQAVKNDSIDDAVLSATRSSSLRRTRSISSSERILELRGPGKHSWSPPVNQADAQPGTNLIVRRLQKTKERLSAEAQEQSQNGLRELQQTFVARQPVLDIENWEFWASVVGDYDTVAREQPERLRKAVQDGFPSELRGLLWQVIASSKSSALEQLYSSLVDAENAPCDAAIAKDLDRTPMAKRVDRDHLARLLRAYSLFDPEVGYTQGMAFIAVPLLLELNEAEAFCLFVQLMKTYDFRSMFLSDMPGLHLKLYQFERLVEDYLEPVHTHLRRQGVQSSMYASQWFLTIFAYRFPPSLVTRIFDIAIAEGLEALLRFATALMEAASAAILERDGLDHLLPFLKEQIFDQFDGRENELVRLASQVELLPQVLSKFELEHQELNRLEKERMNQLDTLRTANARLALQNKNLESTLETLNGEHVQVVNKMITKRWDLVHLQDENQELRQQLAKYHDDHSTYTEVESKLGRLTSELANIKHDKEALQQELDLLRESQALVSTAELVAEVKELREVNKRYASQLGSLQESLASALENR